MHARGRDRGKDSRLEITDSGFRIRDSGFGIRNSGFGEGRLWGKAARGDVEATAMPFTGPNPAQEAIEW
eukprot:746836-Prorocentrum_minimum.AAC.1